MIGTFWPLPTAHAPELLFTPMELTNKVLDLPANNQSSSPSHQRPFVTFYNNGTPAVNPTTDMGHESADQKGDTIFYENPQK
jgi:hypothetical protein